MALQAYKEKTFEANIKFEDDSTKKVIFRLPRSIDVYTSGDGNSNASTLYTLANMAKPFDKPVQVEVDGGSLMNITTVRDLIDLGVFIDFSEAIEKWLEARKKAQEEKDKLLKKSKSGGSSEEELIVTGKQIGRASCRERVSSPV